MCGVLDAVALDDELHADLARRFPAAMRGVRVVLDTRGRFADAIEAVNFTVPRALAQTSSLCFAQQLDRGGLFDWIVARRLMAQYLPNACERSSPANPLLRSLVAAAPWPKPRGSSISGYVACGALASFSPGCQGRYSRRRRGGRWRVQKESGFHTASDRCSMTSTLLLALGNLFISPEPTVPERARCSPAWWARSNHRRGHDHQWPRDHASES
jgi:hypothetical protein